MKLISVVAPIFNEEKIINEFVNQVSQNIEKITNDYEIILIDDGSMDNSWEIISNLCESNKKLVGLKLSKNFGHHHAITAGLHQTNAKWTVVMDTDLQDRPEVIPELYDKAIQGYDVVFVSRKERPESIFYKSLQKIFYFILKLLSGIKFDSNKANFSIISDKVVNAYRNFPEQSRFYGSTILWLGFNSTQIYAKHGKRFSGKPSYSWKKRFKLASEIILAFSDRPLKFAIYLGLIMGFVMIIFFIVIGINLIFNQVILTDRVILLLSIFVMGTFQVTILGVIGIYISKIFLETKKRPLYVIEKKIY